MALKLIRDNIIVTVSDRACLALTNHLNIFSACLKFQVLVNELNSAADWTCQPFVMGLFALDAIYRSISILAFFKFSLLFFELLGEDLAPDRFTRTQNDSYFNLVSLFNRWIHVWIVTLVVGEGLEWIPIELNQTSRFCLSFSSYQPNFDYQLNCIDSNDEVPKMNPAAFRDGGGRFGCDNRDINMK